MIRPIKTLLVLGVAVALNAGNVSRPELLFVRVVPDPLTNGLTPTVIPDGDDCVMHGNYSWYCWKSGTRRPAEYPSGPAVTQKDTWHRKPKPRRELYVPVE